MKCKKIFSIILVAVFTFIIAGCGENNIPDGMSEQVYSAGIKALEITDDYLNFEISKDDAEKQLKEMSERLEDNSKTNNFDENYSTVTCVTLLYLKISNDDSDDEILETRNDLAESIQKPTK